METYSLVPMPMAKTNPEMARPRARRWPIMIALLLAWTASPMPTVDANATCEDIIDVLEDPPTTIDPTEVIPEELPSPTFDPRELCDVPDPCDDGSKCDELVPDCTEQAWQCIPECEDKSATECAEGPYQCGERAWHEVETRLGNGPGNYVKLWHDWYGNFLATWQQSQPGGSPNADAFHMVIGIRSEAGDSVSEIREAQGITCAKLGFMESGKIKWETIGTVVAGWRTISNFCEKSKWSEYSETEESSWEGKASYSVTDGVGGESTVTITKSSTTTNGESITCGDEEVNLQDSGLTIQYPENDLWINVPRCQDSAIVHEVSQPHEGSDRYIVIYKDQDCPAFGDIEIWRECGGDWESWSPNDDCREWSSSEGGALD